MDFVNKYLSLEEFLYKQIIVDDQNEVNMNLDQVLSIFMPVTNIGEVHETHYIDKVNDRRGGVIYRATNSNKKIMNENVAFKIKSLLCSFDNESVSEDRKFFLSRDCSFQSKTKDSTFLDREYTVFGEVTEGMDIADKIVSLDRDGNDCPLEDAKMVKVSISE